MSDTKRLEIIVKLLNELKVPMEKIDWENCIISWPNGLFVTLGSVSVLVEMRVHEDGCHYGYRFSDYREASECVKRNYMIPNGTPLPDWK
jgi:hypothetical protein